MPNPGPRPVFLSEDDVQLLQAVIDEQRRMVHNTQNRPKYTTDEQEQQGPEVYIAKAIETIPATTISAGEVDIYREMGGILVKTGITITAYNPLGIDIRDNAWLIVVRDKFGTYFIATAADTESRALINVLLSVCPHKSGVNVTSLKEMKQPILVPLSWIQGEPICVTDPQDCCNPGTGTGTGTHFGPVVSCCPNTTLPQTLTLTVSGFTSSNGVQNNGNFTLVWNGSAWVSRLFGAFNPATGSGCGEGNKWSLFCTSDGWRLQHSYLSGGLWITDGNGLPASYTCSPFSCSGTGTYTLTGCCGNGEIFKWSVGGEVGGGGSIITSCCPGGIPATLYATFSGSLAALGTVAIGWIPSSSGYYSGPTTACDIGQLFFDCELISGSNQFCMYLLGVAGVLKASCNVQSSCNPFSWSVAGQTITGTCAGTFGCVVTETHP